MYHLKEIPNAAPGGLDLNVADEEEFSPDKLRSNIERLYMTVIIGLMGFGGTKGICATSDVIPFWSHDTVSPLASCVDTPMAWTGDDTLLM